MPDTLWQGQLVRLAAPNPDADVETMAAWSRDPEFQHLLESGPPSLWTVRSLKAELVESQGDEKPHERKFPFVIRTVDGDRLIGFIDLVITDWAQRDAWIGIGIGPREYWGQGYGTEAMRLLM